MTTHRVAPAALGLLFVLIGLVVGTGGVWLMALGGSWYYLPSGLMMVLTGLLLLQGSSSALWVHAGLLAITLAWSLWESGLNGWALVVRGDVVWLLGLVMVTPWFTRGFNDPRPTAAGRGLSTALASFAVVGVMAASAPGATADRIAGSNAAASVDAQRATWLVSDSAMVRLPDDLVDRRFAQVATADLESSMPLSLPLPPLPTGCSSLLLVPTAEGRLVSLNAIDDAGCDTFPRGDDGGVTNAIEFPSFKGFIDKASWHAAAAALHRHIHTPLAQAWPSTAAPARGQEALLSVPTVSHADAQRTQTEWGRPTAEPASTGADMWGLTLFDQLACRIAFEKMRFDGRFARPMAMGLLLDSPQAGGRELVVAGPSDLMFTAEIVPLIEDIQTGPVLAATDGRGAMLSAAYPSTAAALWTREARSATPYAVRLEPFLSPIGLPCQAPPWGLRTAPAAVDALHAPPFPSGVRPAPGRPIAANEADAPAL